MCGVSFFKDPSLPDVESTSEVDDDNTPISTPVTQTNNTPKITSMTPEIETYVQNLKEDIGILEAKKKLLMAKGRSANPKIVKNTLGELNQKKLLLSRCERQIANKEYDKILPKQKTTQPNQVKKETKLTREELEKYLEPKDFKKYNSLSKQLNFDREDLSQATSQKSIDSLKERITLKENALKKLESQALKAKEEYSKPLEKINVKSETVTEIFKDIPLDKTNFNKLMDWADTRLKGNIEYAYQFDSKTGKLIGREIKGKETSVSIPSTAEHIGSAHIHHSQGANFPSHSDIKAYRVKKGKDHLVISEKEVWYVHAEENVGKLKYYDETNRKIDKVYKDCIKQGQDQVQEWLDNGVIKNNYKELVDATNKAIGDRLLHEFAKPEWADRGIIVRRGYRG